MTILRQGSPPSLTTRYLLAACLLVLPASWVTKLQEVRLNSGRAGADCRPRGGETIRRRLTEYSVKARVPVLGDIGHVGTFAVEEEVRRNGEAAEKVFRVFGQSKPELAKKGKDYRGEFELVRRLSPEGTEGSDLMSAGGATGPEILSSGHFNKNGIVESETIAFYRGLAVSRRENGSEKTVAGSCECLISAFEHFLENEVREGDVYQSRFVFGGRPFVFKCEVGRAVRLEPPGATAFPIDFTTYDALERDSTGRLKVVKKKGAIRLWVSKEEPYKNTYLRLKIQYKWYLTLHMEMIRTT